MAHLGIEASFGDQISEETINQFYLCYPTEILGSLVILLVNLYGARRVNRFERQIFLQSYALSTEGPSP